MLVIKDLKNLNANKFNKPVVLTIGNFDGVHSGHQALIHDVLALAEKKGQQSAIITFENHPATVLRPSQAPCFLSNLQHKVKLIERLGVDFLSIIPFTESFSQQTAEEFLTFVHSRMPFSHLILGYDATLGKDRKGNREVVRTIGNGLGFAVEYLEPFTVGGEVVSSSRIREAIKKGDLTVASRLLGRKYSVLSTVITGKTHGKSIGFPTANIDVDHVCLPPCGVYIVTVIYKNQSMRGVANLGMAPTLRADNRIILEVHVLDWNQDFYGDTIEVIFEQFIRSERKFESIDALKAQIGKDVSYARNFL